MLHQTSNKGNTFLSIEDVTARVADALYDVMGAVPHPEYGVISLFPWAVDDDATNALQRQVASGLAQVLADRGLLADRESAPMEPSRDVTLNCRMCSATLLTVHVDAAGVANVPAATIISALARMNVTCPHDIVTADDQRRAIEEAVLIARGDA